MLQLKESQVTLLVWKTDLKTLKKHKKVVYIVRGRSLNSQDIKVSSILKCFQDSIKYLHWAITYK